MVGDQAGTTPDDCVNIGNVGGAIEPLPTAKKLNIWFQTIYIFKLWLQRDFLI